MVSIEGAWSESETEAFLEEAVVPIRIGCHNPAGGLWMLSLWYRHRGEHIECATRADADVVEFLRADEAVCFEVSTNRPPYMGVRGGGTATVAPDERKETIGALVERYLGETGSEMAERLLAEDREEVAITIEPSRLYTWDFTPRMGDSEGAPAARGEPTSPRY